MRCARRIGPWRRLAASWVVDTSTVGGVATATYDQDVPALAGGQPTLCGRDQQRRHPASGRLRLRDRHRRTDEQAFIWTYGSSDFDQLVHLRRGSGATNLSGWDFQYAEGVNNNGEVVGYGTLNGISHAFALLNYSTPGRRRCR